MAGNERLPHADSDVETAKPEGEGFPAVEDGLVRFGVSCSRKLLQAFDRRIRHEGYNTRSDALSSLMRESLRVDKVAGDEEVVGTVTLVYDHHRRDLSDNLLETQHRYHDEVLSTLHIHLGERDCLEVVVVKGKAGFVQEFADRLISTRGVKSGKLVVSAVFET